MLDDMVSRNLIQTWPVIHFSVITHWLRSTHLSGISLTMFQFLDRYVEPVVHVNQYHLNTHEETTTESWYRKVKRVIRKIRHILHVLVFSWQNQSNCSPCSHLCLPHYSVSFHQTLWHMLRYCCWSAWPFLWVEPSVSMGDRWPSCLETDIQVEKWRKVQVNTFISL